MRLALLKSSVLSLTLCVLATTTGCASGQTTRQAVSPGNGDTSSDPSWTPPGEMNLAVTESTRGPQEARVNAETMPQPNRRDVPKGQLHAVTY